MMHQFKNYSLNLWDGLKSIQFELSHYIFPAKKSSKLWLDVFVSSSSFRAKYEHRVYPKRQCLITLILLFDAKLCSYILRFWTRALHSACEIFADRISLVVSFIKRLYFLEESDLIKSSWTELFCGQNVRFDDARNLAERIKKKLNHLTVVGFNGYTLGFHTNSPSAQYPRGATTLLILLLSWEIICKVTRGILSTDDTRVRLMMRKDQSQRLCQNRDEDSQPHVLMTSDPITHLLYF